VRTLVNRPRGRFAWTNHINFQVTQPGSSTVIYTSVPIEAAVPIQAAMNIAQVSLLLIGQQDLEDFFRYRSFLPIGWRIVQILCRCRGKTTNTAPTTFSAI
jgi:hypothetical protein